MVLCTYKLREIGWEPVQNTTLLFSHWWQIRQAQTVGPSLLSCFLSSTVLYWKLCSRVLSMASVCLTGNAQYWKIQQIFPSESSLISYILNCPGLYTCSEVIVLFCSDQAHMLLHKQMPPFQTVSSKFCSLPVSEKTKTSVTLTWWIKLLFKLNYLERQK